MNKAMVLISLCLVLGRGNGYAQQAQPEQPLIGVDLKDDDARIKALFELIRSRNSSRSKCEGGVRLILDMERRKPASRAELFFGSPNWHWYLSRWLYSFRENATGSNDPERAEEQWAFLAPWERRFYPGAKLSESKPGDLLESYLRSLGYLQNDGSNYPRKKKIKAEDKPKILAYVMRLWDEATSAPAPGAPLREPIVP